MVLGKNEMGILGRQREVWCLGRMKWEFSEDRERYGAWEE